MSEWEVVIVPPSIVESKPDSELRQALAERLGGCLAWVDEDAIRAVMQSL